MPQFIVMPAMGMYNEEGVLTAWLRPEGARVDVGEPILEITTEKVTFEVPSPAAGILHHVVTAGTSLQVQAILGYILAEGEAPPSGAAEESTAVRERGSGPLKTPAPQLGTRAAGPPRSSPAARRLAAKHGIDLNSVKGSGPGGRIVEADVLARISQQQASATPRE